MTTNKPNRRPGHGPTVRLVDMKILDAVHKAATCQLELLRAYERQTGGVAKTTLADVARAALASWTPPTVPPSNKRPLRRGQPVHTYRFHVPVDSYPKVKKAIHAAGQSVAGVVQDGLERFARTGKY